MEWEGVRGKEFDCVSGVLRDLCDAGAARVDAAGADSRIGIVRVNGMEPEERDARRIVLVAAIHHLEEGRKRDGAASEHLYDDVIHRYRHRLAALSGLKVEGMDGWDSSTYSRQRSITESALRTERRTLIGLRESGKIGDEALRTLERELDLAESRYQGMPTG